MLAERVSHEKQQVIDPSMKKKFQGPFAFALIDHNHRTVTDAKTVMLHVDIQQTLAHISHYTGLHRIVGYPDTALDLFEQVEQPRRIGVEFFCGS